MITCLNFPHETVCFPRNMEGGEKVTSKRIQIKKKSSKKVHVLNYFFFDEYVLNYFFSNKEKANFLCNEMFI